MVVWPKTRLRDSHQVREKFSGEAHANCGGRRFAASLSATKNAPEGACSAQAMLEFSGMGRPSLVAFGPNILLEASNSNDLSVQSLWFGLRVARDRPADPVRKSRGDHEQTGLGGEDERIGKG